MGEGLKRSLCLRPLLGSSWVRLLPPAAWLTPVPMSLHCPFFIPCLVFGLKKKRRKFKK